MAGGCALGSMVCVTNSVILVNGDLQFTHEHTHTRAAVIAVSVVP